MSDLDVSGNGSDDLPMTQADRLNEALLEFAGCIAEGLDDICSYAVTIGQSYVPFNPDEDEECDADEAICSQAWVRVMSVNPTNQQFSFAGGDGCATALSLQLEVGVMRCIEIPEDGEAPTATDVIMASMQSMQDMLAIQCAAASCKAFESDLTTGQWSPSGPLGGQYGGIWTFSAEFV